MGSFHHGMSSIHRFVAKANAPGSQTNHIDPLHSAIIRPSWVELNINLLSWPGPQCDILAQPAPPYYIHPIHICTLASFMAGFNGDLPVETF